MENSSPRPAAVFGGILLTILVMVVLSTGIKAPALQPIAKEYPDITFFLLRSFHFVFVALLWLYATKIERQPLLIWKDKNYSFGTFVAHLFALIFIISICIALVSLFITRFVHEGPSKVLHQIVLFLRHYPFLLVYTALTAGITEELIFRGYLQTRLELLTKSPYAAIFISSVIFGLAHFSYGTIRNMIGPFIIGLGLATYYWKYRNIKVTMVFHFLWDLAGLLLLVRHVK
jgi:membrane protease YdiL (CAAX protease family)